jgi:uncharacterized protein involved in exopolysaccharide biosynthesis
MYNIAGELNGPAPRRLHPGMLPGRGESSPAPTKRPETPPDAAARAQPAGAVASPAGPIDIDAVRVLGWMRRSATLIAAATVALALVGVGYALVTKPRFTARAELVVDPSNLQIVPDNLYPQSQQRDSQLLEVESMLDVLVSGNTLSRVVSDLDLADDPEFVQPAGFDLSGLLGLGPARPVPAAVRALETLASRVKAVRDDGSFVVDVDVWTSDPGKSVRVADSVVTAFQQELADEEEAGARRSVDNLTSQLAQLKADVKAADDAVEAFRRAHGLQQSNGQTAGAQSMTQLNAQLTDAQTRLIAAQARYDALTGSGSPGASSEALQSATMVALRTQYATVKQQYDSTAASLGRLHPTMIELARQVKAAEDQIQREIARTVAAAKSDVDAAQAALAAIEAKASAARAAVADDDQAQVQLRELQREADSATAIYQAYLSRADELAQRQQINTTNVRVISPPVQPKKSWPPSPLLAAGAGAAVGLLLGALLAAGLGLLRDTRTRQATAAR